MKKVRLVSKMIKPKLIFSILFVICVSVLIFSEVLVEKNKVSDNLSHFQVNKASFYSVKENPAQKMEVIKNKDIMGWETDVKNGSSGSLAKENLGYLVTVNVDKKFERTITKDPGMVIQLFEQHLQTDLDIIKILNKSPYFDMKTNNVYFYAEVGMVKSGKNGKLKFRKLKKTEKK